MVLCSKYVNSVAKLKVPFSIHTIGSINNETIEFEKSFFTRKIINAFKLDAKAKSTGIVCASSIDGAQLCKQKKEVVFGAKLVDTDECDLRTGERLKLFQSQNLCFSQMIAKECMLQGKSFVCTNQFILRYGAFLFSPSI